MRNTNLVRAVGHGIRQDAIDTYRRERQRQCCENHEENHQEAWCARERVRISSKVMTSRDGQPFVQEGYTFADGVERARRIVGCPDYQDTRTGD